MIDVCVAKWGKKLSEHPESRGGTIGICGHIWSCHLPLGQNFTPTLRIHNILSVESARKINPIVSLCWVKMCFIVWYSFRGKYLSDSIILCKSNHQNIHIIFFFHYSSEFSVKDQQFSINLIQTLLKSANFQGAHYLWYNSISFFPRPIHWITENITKSNLTSNTKYCCKFEIFESFFFGKKCLF